MPKTWKKPLFLICSLPVCLVLSLTTGCASGGFKLTREYAGFVNRQDLIIRIILYIFTFVIFGVTLLIDFVIFNTMDFWDGRVSAGTYNFQGDNKYFVVKHEVLPDQRKKSTIDVTDMNHKPLQQIIMSQTTTGEIEVYVDGKLRTRVHNISELPMISTFDAKGTLEQDKPVLFTGLAAGLTAMGDLSSAISR